MKILLSIFLVTLSVLTYAHDRLVTQEPSDLFSRTGTEEATAVDRAITSQLSNICQSVTTKSFEAHCAMGSILPGALNNLAGFATSFTGTNPNACTNVPLVEPSQELIDRTNREVLTRVAKTYISIHDEIRQLITLSPGLRESIRQDPKILEHCSPNSFLASSSRVSNTPPSGVGGGSSFGNFLRDNLRVDRANVPCNSERCLESHQELKRNFQELLGIEGVFTTEALAKRLESNAVNMQCFSSSKDAVLAEIVTPPAIRIIKDHNQRKAIRLSILNNQLSQFSSIVGDVKSVCSAETNRNQLKDKIFSRLNTASNPGNFFNTAFKFNTQLPYQLAEIIKNPGFSKSDCQDLVQNIKEVKKFYEESIEALNNGEEGQQFKKFIEAHNRFVRATDEINEEIDFLPNLKDKLTARCAALKVSALSASCLSNQALSRVKGYFDGSSTERQCLKPIGEDSHVLQKASEFATRALSIQPLVPLISQEEQNSHSDYCPKFDEFMAGRKSEFCDSATQVRDCVAGLSPEQRRNMQNAYFAWLDTESPSEAPLVRERHQALVAASKASVVVDPGSASNLIGTSNDYIGKTLSKDDPNFASYANILGSIPSSELSVSKESGPMFNDATTQAFATQARVSPATSGAVMSRFIAAVPPMQNMPQQQQRQQMDQALERSVNQTVAELENKAAGTTSASERQKYLDEIAELRRLMADQTARNDLITQQMAAMNQAPAEETQAAPTKRKRAPASVANTSPESPEVQSTGFQTGGGRSSGASASSGSVGGSQDLAGAQGFGGGTAAAGRSVSSVSEARDAAPNDSSLRLVVGGAGGQVIPAAQVITISVPSGDEQALKEAILAQRERLNVGEDGYALVEIIDPSSRRASLVRVKIENDNVIVQNFTAEQLRNTTIVSEANPQPRQIRYSLQAMTNLLNQASGGSN